MEGFTHERTTNRLRESRIIKLWIYSTIFNVIVFIASLLMFRWINLLILNGAYAETGLEGDSLLQILKITMIAVLPSQTTITTAVIARYGLREATGNIGAGMAVQGNTDK